ncbi:MAG: asparagine synthase C-terminal domain-containing protein [Nitrososphaerales archaeon]
MQLGYVRYDDLLPDIDHESVVAILKKLETVARECVAKTVHENSLLTYSAGIDSSILAEFMRMQLGEVSLLTLGRLKSSDVQIALQDPLAKGSGFNFVLENIEVSQIEEAARDVLKIVSVSNLAHFEDCVSFWLAASAANKTNNIHYIASANGPDELFCGYDRFRRIVDEQGYLAAEKEILKALDSADKLRKQVSLVVSKFGYETCEPFLEPEFREFSTSIPIEYKILKGNDIMRKRIWRCLGRVLEVPDATVVRRKKAMQYGMGIHQVVLSMVKKNMINIRSETG